MASQWSHSRNVGLTPQDVKPHSNRRVWWTCDVGHSWLTSVSTRTRGSGCPACGVERRARMRRVAKPGRSLLENRPDLVNEWLRPENGEATPASVSIGSRNRVWWICRICRHEWISTVANRCQGKGCPACAGRTVVAGQNDLRSRFPEIARGWHPTKNGDLTPAQVAPNHAKKVWWQCEYGHAWQTTPNQRVSRRASSNESGCPFCSGQSVLKGFNDLRSTHPDLADEWHPTKNGSLRPEDVTAGSRRKVWWRKQCHPDQPEHEWMATIASRRKHGCSVCRGLTVQVGINDLATERPLLALEWHPTKNGRVTPQQVPRSSGKRVWWLCANGHEWEATVNSRDRGRGCNSCARFGFVPSMDGWLYLLRHDGWGLLQVGISNDPERRLDEHRRNGWEPIDVRGPMPGDLTAALERDVLAAVRRTGARIGSRADKHKFDGYTESWTALSLDVSSIRELMALVSDEE